MVRLKGPEREVLHFIVRTPERRRHLWHSSADFRVEKEGFGGVIRWIGGEVERREADVPYIKD